MMEQYTDKELLKKLFGFLQKQILSNPANHWFANDLYKILAPVSEARISDIHEQCIEDVIKAQAIEFYKDFALEDLRPQLIKDFIKMEHWRRRDNLQEFCMALYQQIEAITNRLGADELLNSVWRDIRNEGFFVDVRSKDIRIRWSGSDSIEHNIVYNPENYGKELSQFVAMDKFKAVLFLVVYKVDVDVNNVKSFNADFNLGYDIYMMRNLNHRGNDLTGYTSERISKMFNNSTNTMCKLIGFYARFVECINNNIPVSDDIVEFAEISRR